MERPPTLWTHLTREELLTAWALAYVGMFQAYEDAYPLAAHASPGLEGPSTNPGEMTRRAIRYLALEHGYDFPGVEVTGAGAVSLVSEVEPRNLVFLLRMLKARMGGQEHASMPISPIVAYRTALAWLPEHCPGVELSALREALTETEAAAGEWRDRLTPEEFMEEQQILDEALAAVGVQRVGKGATN